MEGILQQFIKKFNANPALISEKKISTCTWHLPYGNRANGIPTVRTLHMGDLLLQAVHSFFSDPFLKQDIFQTYKVDSATRGLKIHTALTPYTDAQWMRWILLADSRLKAKDFQCIASTDSKVQRGIWRQTILKRTYQAVNSESALPILLICEVVLQENKMVNIHWLVEYQPTDVPHAAFKINTVIESIFQ